MRRFFLIRAITSKKSFWLLVAGLLVSWCTMGFIASAAPPPQTLPPLVYFAPNDVPSQVLIGEEFKFKVRFKQQSTNTGIGYGPFIDLVLDARGGNITRASTCPCNGITFVSAAMVEVNGGPIALPSTPPSPINTYPCGSTLTPPVTHPFGTQDVSGILPFTAVPQGAQLVTLALPFGSFVPTAGDFAGQPEIVVEVTAQVSNLADNGFPLKIYARGGFRYGADPLNNPGANADPPILSDQNPPGTQVTNPTQWSAQAQTIPRVMIIKKDYNGPEDETATGPNYKHTYLITVDIANGQTIANPNLIVHDSLPNNMAYDDDVLVHIHGIQVSPGNCTTNPNADYQLTKQPLPGVAHNPPVNLLEVTFCHQITGNTDPNDVTVQFRFFIPQVDANGIQVLIWKNCTPANPVTSINAVDAEGGWMPQNPCDQNLHHIKQEATDTLLDKCIAIQKSAAMFIDTGTTGLTPDDTLTYTLKFQVSDYKTIGNLVVTDFLSNGQELAGPTPLLIVSDQFGMKKGAFPTGTITTTYDPKGAAHYCPPPIQYQKPLNGTVLTFNLKAAMAVLPGFSSPRLNAGVLTGGYAAGPPPPSTAATGTIVFHAHVRDAFQYSVPAPGDPFVDKDDPINNCVVIQGQVLQNVTDPSPGHAGNKVPNSPIGSANDDSATHLSIITDTLKKSVYAVKRGPLFICGPSGPACSNSPSSPQEVRPGDQVTFRVEKTIPSGDAEPLTIQDFLPLPIFDVKDPDANGAPGPAFVLLLPLCSPSNPPGPGNACRLMPGNTLPATPTLTQDSATNSIKFVYPNFNNLANLQRGIDLLFTITVTDLPFADNLFLTNEAQECEKNTFGDTFCQAAIAQVNVREPNLRITKGVVAKDNPNGVFIQPLNPPGIWEPFGSPCPRFNAPITSANLGGLINSDLYNIDASDSVTFAIAIENAGGAPAYQIVLADIFPLGPTDALSCFAPNFSGLCVYSGNGVPIPFTTAPGGQGKIIITLAPGFSLAPGSPSNPNGTNIAIITFNAQLLDKDHLQLQPDCPCNNVAQLQHYTSTAQPVIPDPNFVDAGFTPPFSDSAKVCVNPTLEKSIVATSEAHTTLPQVAIGEIVRYRLLVRLPESTDPNFQVKDALAPGMRFLNDNSARIVFISNQVMTHTALPATFNVIGATPLSSAALYTPQYTIPASVILGGANCGDPVTFSLGDVTNNDNDPDLEYIEIEFNALVCNLPCNHNGTTLSNTFSVWVKNAPIATSPPINVTVVEPNLVVTKDFSGYDPNGVRTFTVTLTNNGTTDAFDVHMTDILPPGLILAPSFYPIPHLNLNPSACAAPLLPPPCRQHRDSRCSPDACGLCYYVDLLGICAPAMLH